MSAQAAAAAALFVIDVGSTLAGFRARRAQRKIYRMQMRVSRAAAGANRAGVDYNAAELAKETNQVTRDRLAALNASGIRGTSQIGATASGALGEAAKQRQRIETARLAERARVDFDLQGVLAGLHEKVKQSNLKDFEEGTKFVKRSITGETGSGDFAKTTGVTPTATTYKLN